MAEELREKHLFVIKFFGKDGNLDEGETVASVLTGLEQNHVLTTDSIDGGWVGVVSLLQTEEGDFFHAIRAITARINGVSKADAVLMNKATVEAMLSNGGPFAKWAHISFAKLVESFTFIGNPDENLDTNDYCIVPPELSNLIAGNAVVASALRRDEARRKEVGMLGGIGGHQGG